MKRKVRYVLLLITTIVTTKSFAQYDALFTQYMYNEMFINPAFAGSRDAMSATLLHRQQWLSFKGRPVTTTFSLHGPLKLSRMGAGVSVLNEQIGVLNRNLAYLTYAYRVKTGKESRLSFGLMAGIHNQVTRFDQLHASPDGAIDPNVTQSAQNVMSFNFGTGIYYSTPLFYAGLSVPRIMNDRVTSGKKPSFDAKAMHYYITTGKIFKFRNDILLRTQAMGRIVSGAPAQLDVNASVFLLRALWVGAGYRTNAAACGLLGFQPNKQLFIGYSYDFDIHGLQKYTSGSHEIVLSYLFKYDLTKTLSPRYF